ncbi:hypothetical protein LTR53_016751 [Teratosphaeriaceae sp. CCFEE 6253]|nr:hypothetical protein LTR53_016751 [Teratosphaeriaceae sp. CCFEE 6253]
MLVDMGSPISPFVLMISVPAISTSVYSSTSMIVFLLANVLMMRCEMQTRGRSRSWRVQDRPGVNIPIVSSYVHATMDEFVVNDTYRGGNMRQSGVGNEFEEKDRRDRAIEVVPRNKFDLERLYTPLVAKEYLSLLFRQRGVSRVDTPTSQIVASFRRSVGLDPDLHDTVRRIVTLGKRTNHNIPVTMRTIEPVVATMCIRGNSINVAEAKKRFMGMIRVEDTLPSGHTSPRSPATRSRGGHDRLPDQDESTRLKIEPGLDRPRSTSLTVYGNGSMQFTGSPIDIPVLYPSLIELIKMAITSEMARVLDQNSAPDLPRLPQRVCALARDHLLLVLPNASAIRMVWMPWYVAHALISSIVSMSKERSQEDPLTAAYLYLRRFRFIIADAMALA